MKGPNYVYWCGDATLAYPRKPGEVRHWWGRLDDLYKDRDVRHLQRYNRHVLFVRNRYFVILDDLAASKPTRFSWLYHILPDQDFTLDKTTGSFAYSVENVRVYVNHLLGKGEVDVLDQVGDEGFKNPLTGENYIDNYGRAKPPRKFVAQHNIYITNREPAQSWRYLSTIVPVPPDSPDAAPIIEKLDDLTLRITFLGETDVISFDPTNSEADIVVDLPVIAKEGLHSSGH